MILLADTMMIRWRMLLFVLISLVVPESDASFIEISRILGQVVQSETKSNQVSPSPMLVPGPADPPKAATLGDGTCDKVPLKCHDVIDNMTACLPSAANGFRGSVLHVQNDGERHMNLTVTLRPANYTYDNIEIPKYQFKKINISSNIGGSSSIIVNGGNGNCVIYIGATAPLERLFGGYVTPINAAYLVFGTIVLIGGMWACCRMKEKERHLDGVPYQELEMEQQQQQQSLPYVGVEAGDNWDQSWDDDWDEEKAVRSPGETLLRSRLANGVSSGAVDTEEWGSD